MKLKVIQIAHASHSYFLENGKGDLRRTVVNDWYSQTAQQIKKYNPEIQIECWAPEKLNDTEEIFFHAKIKYRIFPTTFSPIYALDFSIPMLRALKDEFKKAEKNKTKLIIHLHEYHNLHGLLISTLFKNQRIISQHHGGSWPLKHIKNTKRYKFLFPFFLIGQLWENRTLKNIDVFYALAEDEIYYLKKTAPNSEVRFQTMGIEEEYFKKVDKKTARKKLNLQFNKKIIIYLGRINSVKGIKFLIDAMKELKDIELKILGFGPQETEFKKYIKNIGLKNVEFMGGIFGERKMLYLSAADALVLPSSKEGAPVSVMEAMARDVPIIATNVGGVPLMIKEDKNGILIRPKNSEDIIHAVRKILKNPPKNIKKYAERYKWEKIIEKTVEDYKK